MDDQKTTSIHEHMSAISKAGGVADAVERAMSMLPSFSLSAARQHHQPLIPEIHSIPTPKDRDEYQSASALMRSIAAEAVYWKDSLPKNFRPAILAILYGGIQVDVRNLSQVSFHGIRVEGTINGTFCSMLAHQATFQLLCYAEEIKPDEPQNPIGFIWGDEKVEV